MSPYTVAQMIESGDRLQKPTNAACSKEMYEKKALVSQVWDSSTEEEESGIWDLATISYLMLM